MMFVNIR